MIGPSMVDEHMFALAFVITLWTTKVQELLKGVYSPRIIQLDVLSHT
jgi:hypothetical protein